MLTDLRYAMRQLAPLLNDDSNSLGKLPVRTIHHRVQKALEVLERCVEAAEADEVARGLTDADLEAIFAEVPADPMPTQMIPASELVIMGELEAIFPQD